MTPSFFQPMIQPWDIHFIIFTGGYEYLMGPSHQVIINEIALQTRAYRSVWQYLQSYHYVYFIYPKLILNQSMYI